MIKSRLTFSWFYYYFKIRWDGVSQTTPSFTCTWSESSCEMGWGCRAGGKGEFLETSSLLYVLCLQIRFFLHIGFPAEKSENLCGKTLMWKHNKHWHFRSCALERGQTPVVLVGQFVRMLRNRRRIP